MNVLAYPQPYAIENKDKFDLNFVEEGISSLDHPDYIILRPKDIYRGSMDLANGNEIAYRYRRPCNYNKTVYSKYCVFKFHLHLLSLLHFLPK